MTQATMARPHAPRRSLPPVSVVVLFVVGALVCVGMAFALEDPEVVPRVTVENRSTMPVNVDVRGSADGKRLILGTVPAGATVSTLEVLEQGDDWIFGFTSGGVDGGSVHMARSRLAGEGWRLVVPAHVVDRLQTAPFIPPYR
jgi:hypothetical protein